MPGGRFDHLVRLDEETLEIGGIFVTHGDVIGEATVRFVLIPDDNRAALEAPIIGTALIEKGPRLPNSELSEARFKAEVADPYHLEEGKKVRGIGIAVSVKASDPPDSASERRDPDSSSDRRDFDAQSDQRDRDSESDRRDPPAF